jgi:hypothetical protein
MFSVCRKSRRLITSAAIALAAYASFVEDANKSRKSLSRRVPQRLTRWTASGFPGVHLWYECASTTISRASDRLRLIGGICLHPELIVGALQSVQKSPGDKHQVERDQWGRSSRYAVPSGVSVLPWQQSLTWSSSLGGGIASDTILYLGNPGSANE